VAFGEHRVGLLDFWGGSMAFVFSFVFGFDSVLAWGVFDVFWCLRCVLVGFLLVIMLKKRKLWVLENIR